MISARADVVLGGCIAKVCVTKFAKANVKCDNSAKVKDYREPANAKAQQSEIRFAKMHFSCAATLLAVI